MPFYGNKWKTIVKENNDSQNITDDKEYKNKTNTLNNNNKNIEDKFSNQITKIPKEENYDFIYVIATISVLILFFSVEK